MLVNGQRWTSVERLIDERVSRRHDLFKSLPWWIGDHGLLRARSAEIDRLGSERVPDFLCIGAQKAGTSWLAAALRAHPDVFVPDQKELHYFDRHLGAPVSEYLAHFTDANQLVVGELTPAYALLPVRRVRLVWQVNSALRIVMLLRHPAERAWSQARMEVLNRTGRSVEQVTSNELLRHLRSAANTMRSDYHTTIAKWTNMFGASSLQLCSFADLVDRPRVLMASVFNHIGVDPDRMPSGVRLDFVVHRGLSSRPPRVVVEFLQKQYRGAQEDLESRYGIDLNPVESWMKADSDDSNES